MKDGSGATVNRYDSTFGKRMCNRNKSVNDNWVYGGTERLNGKSLREDSTKETYK